MITRKQYLDNDQPDANHDAYYQDVIKAAGLTYKFKPEFMAKLREEYAGGNTSFNSGSSLINQANARDMALSRWDALSHATNTRAVYDALKERGDYLTLSGQVCLIKQLAKMAVKSESIT